jgi:hypothetical protein
MCIDIGNMYLNTKLLSPEYMRIHIDLKPEEIQHEYNTKEFADKDGYVYMEVIGAIYGLSQSGYLANQDLIKNSATFGYHPVKRIPGLWKHETRRTTFTLVVDDFGVQYFSKEDANHLTGFRIRRQYWPQFWGHFFKRGISPSKIGPIAPFLDTIQPLSSTRAFLLVKDKQRLLCMGRTFTVDKPFAL